MKHPSSFGRGHEAPDRQTADALHEGAAGPVELRQSKTGLRAQLRLRKNYLAAKRIADFSMAMVLGPTILVVIALLGAAIKLDTRGPVFYRQERVGCDGKCFTIIKLRTMHLRPAPSGEWERREDAKTKHGDHRITKVGKFLRLSRLDELPQVWNVLKGEMSWIGPRPEARELAEWHSAKIPQYDLRHSIKPGITGWSQANLGHVTELDAIRTRLEYEVFYIENMSLRLDLLIAFKTIGVMITGRGAR